MTTAGLKVSVKVEGANQIIRGLRGLDAKLRKKAYRAALTKAGRLVVAESRKLAEPRVKAFGSAMTAGRAKGMLDDARTTQVGDTLAKGIMYKVSVTKQKNEAIVGLTKGLLSGGRVKGQKRVLEQEGFAREYGTLRAPARPFIRPALDAVRDDVVRIYSATLNDAIQKELRGII